MKNTVGGKDNELNKKILEYQKDSPLAKDIKNEDDGWKRSRVFDSAVMDATFAASRMYRDGDCSLDEIIDDLIDWLEKCKGKEKELLNSTKEDSDDY